MAHNTTHKQVPVPEQVLGQCLIDKLRRHLRPRKSRAQSRRRSQPLPHQTTIEQYIRDVRKAMEIAAKELDFIEAARYGRNQKPKGQL